MKTILLKLILFVFLINTCKSDTTFQDITYRYSINGNSNYVNYGTTPTCNFQLYYYVTNDNGNLITELYDGSSTFTSNLILYDPISSTSIIRLDSLSKLSVGIYQITLETFIGDNSTTTFEIECIGFDTSSINIELISKLRLINNEYRGTLRMDGITIDVNKGYNYPIAFSDYYIVHIVGTPYLDITVDKQAAYGSNKLSFDLYIMGESIQFEFSDFIDRNNDEISNFKISQPVIQMGYGYNGIMSFTSIIELNKGTFYQLSPDGSSFSLMECYPVLSKDNLITYMSPINPIVAPSVSSTLVKTIVFDASTATKFKIYSQNGPTFKNAINSSIDNIKSITFNSFPQTSNIQYNITKSTYQSVTQGFNSINPFDFVPIIHGLYSSISIELNAPYGFKSGSFNSYIYQSSIPVRVNSNFQPYYSINSAFDNSGPTMRFNYNTVTTNLPIVKSWEYVHLFGNYFVLRMNIVSQYGINRIGTQYQFKYSLSSLISGTPNDGIFELLINILFPLEVLYIIDNVDSSLELHLGEPISINPLLMFTAPIKDSISNDIYNNIQNLSFKFNDIDVTNKSVSNTLYFNVTGNLDKNTTITLIFVDSGSNSYVDGIYSEVYLQDGYFYGYWNETVKLFQVDFFIKANSQSDSSFPFFLLFNKQIAIQSNSLPLSNQLRVKSSNMDLYGPVFKSIVKINDSLAINNNTGNIGWRVIIEDLYNGFDYGVITIKSTIDGSIYNFTITPLNVINGDRFIGEYELLINVYSPCISQKLVITDVLLFDTMGRKSEFNLYQSFAFEIESTFNPFINYLSDSTINIVSFTCTPQPESNDITPPKIISFSLLSSYIVDVGSNNKTVSIIFQTQDLESGIKFGNGLQNPIVYLSTTDLNVISNESTIVNITFTTVNYKCDIELPIAFGYPNGILISIYGIINNNGLFSGYSDIDLNSTFGMSSFINTIYSFSTPLIINNLPISEYGGSLYLFGKSFQIGDIVKISYSDNNLGFETHTIGIAESVAISVLNVKKTRNPFLVKVIRCCSSTVVESNVLIITPVLYGSSAESSTGSSSESSTILPTLSPLPTNAPQICKSNCGGSKNGYCSSSGCVCYSPWVGLDCLSETIVVPQPIINGSNPSIEIPFVPGENNGGTSTNSVLFKSLVSFVSIREIGFDNSIINEYPLDKWVSLKINNSTQQYDTSISVLQKQNGGISSITNITITLEWFKDFKNITFANEQLKMNPSTLKYTIQISSYEFKSNLNKLQLVMSALFESSKSDDICSLLQFGDTSSGDNSNYIKIQVDQYSLYGRFIKRGIIDNTVLSVSNELLDSSFNSITKSNQAQSYIGINIPHFLNGALIDPDFSILLDSNSVSNDDSNSFCNKKPKSLSSAQLVGIIIGSVAFAAAVTISITYSVLKKRKDRKFALGLQNKLKQLDK